MLWKHKHRKVILLWDQSSTQVLGKSDQYFLCNPADKPMKQPTNQQTDIDENITSLAEVIILKILDNKN